MLQEAVAGVVARQVDAGVDVVSDGEKSKAGYSTYVTRAPRPASAAERTPLRGQQRRVDFPELGRAAAGRHRGDARHARLHRRVAYAQPARSSATSRTCARRSTPIRRAEAFMTAASPGVIAHLPARTSTTPSHEDYLVRARRRDAQRVRGDRRRRLPAAARLPGPRDRAPHPVRATPALEEFRRATRAARRGAQPRAREHPARARCACTSAGATTRARTTTTSRCARSSTSSCRRAPAPISVRGAPTRATSTSGASSRTSTLPDDKVLIPGVIDSTTNYIEHPELVAERIVRLARLVGRERVIAGTDCGFATFAGFAPVFPSIVYAKLGALAEGAERASEELWARPARAWRRRRAPRAARRP